MMFRMA